MFRFRFPRFPNPDDMITSCAKRFIALYDNAEGADMRAQAEQTRIDLQKLTQEITACYTENSGQGDFQLFRKLALYFSQDSLTTVTSYELLSSKIVDALLEQFSEQNPRYAEARATFLQAFMIPDAPVQHVEGNQPATPFGVFVHKLQDLLSRSGTL